MAPSIFADAWRSMWHNITTNDRHASHDSPFRTGGHVPLSQSRHAPLTSITTTAFESRTDLAYPAENPDVVATRNSNGHMSPNTPYSPGMRSALRRQSTDRASVRSSTDKTPAAEIQMQNFDQGLPPPPPVGHSWKRIDRWVEDNYQELYDNLCEGATVNDVNELEHELDCTLPVDVRESLQVHDGQERGGRPSGVLFGCMLLDCEEIVDEWNNWRKVNEQYLAKQPAQEVRVQLPLKAFAAGASSSSSEPTIPVSQPKEQNSLWREELLGKQDSQPPNAVQKAYVHPSWIPLARDWGGNCIAVDLAPGPLGKWGQIIIFGRDYDCKFVIARSWSHFLACVADDFGHGDRIWVEEDSGELKFRQFKQQGVEPPYLEILRWRCDQRYGRRGPRRRVGSPVNGAPAGPGLKINPNTGAPPFDASGSPYGSPTSVVSERGRSPQRFPGKPIPRSMSTASPRRQHISSPLARVAEESPVPIRSKTEPLIKTSGVITPMETPRPSSDFPATGFSVSSPASGAAPTNESPKAKGSPEAKTEGHEDSKEAGQAAIAPSGANTVEKPNAVIPANELVPSEDSIQPEATSIVTDKRVSVTNGEILKENMPLTNGTDSKHTSVDGMVNPSINGVHTKSELGPGQLDEVNAASLKSATKTTDTLVVNAAEDAGKQTSVDELKTIEL